MPDLVYEIIELLVAILRFLGLAVFGVGFGWLGLDLLKKSSAWQVQIAVFLGLAGIVIALTVFSGGAALAALAAGIGVAVLIWGFPKKEKEVKK